MKNKGLLAAIAASALTTGGLIADEAQAQASMNFEQFQSYKAAVEVAQTTGDVSGLVEVMNSVAPDNPLAQQAFSAINQVTAAPTTAQSAPSGTTASAAGRSVSVEDVETASIY